MTLRVVVDRLASSAIDSMAISFLCLASSLSPGIPSSARKMSADGPPGVLVSAIVSVDNTDWLFAELHAAADTFKAAGVRKVWVFRAFDDPHEVLILQDIDTEDNARRWIHQHDAAADWMEHAGVGVYPPLFVGEFLKMVRVDDPDADEGR